jgi:hypothetical protein
MTDIGFISQENSVINLGEGSCRGHNQGVISARGKQGHASLKEAQIYSNAQNRYRMTGPFHLGGLRPMDDERTQLDGSFLGQKRAP